MATPHNSPRTSCRKNQAAHIELCGIALYFVPPPGAAQNSYITVGLEFGKNRCLSKRNTHCFHRAGAGFILITFCVGNRLTTGTVGEHVHTLLYSNFFESKTNLKYVKNCDFNCFASAPINLQWKLKMHTLVFEKT